MVAHNMMESVAISHTILRVDRATIVGDISRQGSLDSGIADVEYSLIPHPFILDSEDDISEDDFQEALDYIEE